MYQIGFNKPEHIHFIGIGGISVSDLAEILLDGELSIPGPDSHETALTEHLEKKGARIYYGQRVANTEREPETSVVVYTTTIHEDNPELRAARDQGLPMLSRAEFLGEPMRNYKEAITTSGIHGKTTTTSMLMDILLAGNSDPTISVGGILRNVGGNIRVGGPDLSVVGACEYTNSFLSFYPTMEVILNVEEDHLDFFKNTEDIRHSSRLFADKLPAKGFLAINSGIEGMGEITKDLNYRVVIFGKDLSSTYTARNMTYGGFARPSYNLVVQGEAVSHITLSATREHNAYNSLAAAAAALELGVEFDAVMLGLGGSIGTDRRFEKKGEVAGVMVIDDYTHHSQEIRATLAAARNCPRRGLWYVFQPHIYARTGVFLDQFAGALLTANGVVLADVYTIRETDTLGVSSRDMANRVERLGTRAHYIPSFDEIEAFILEDCMDGNSLVTMGAGDIVEAGEKLLGQ